ncbi:MAG: hypothetical protein V1798_04440, partial [Pseudomonadota bacterium]
AKALVLTAAASLFGLPSAAYPGGSPTLPLPRPNPYHLVERAPEIPAPKIPAPTNPELLKLVPRTSAAGARASWGLKFFRIAGVALLVVNELFVEPMLHPGESDPPWFRKGLIIPEGESIEFDRLYAYFQEEYPRLFRPVPFSGSGGVRNEDSHPPAEPKTPASGKNVGEEASEEEMDVPALVASVDRDGQIVRLQTWGHPNESPQGFPISAFPTQHVLQGDLFLVRYRLTVFGKDSVHPRPLIRAFEVLWMPPHVTFDMGLAGPRVNWPWPMTPSQAVAHVMDQMEQAVWHDVPWKNKPLWKVLKAGLLAAEAAEILWFEGRYRQRGHTAEEKEVLARLQLLLGVRQTHLEALLAPLKPGERALIRKLVEKGEEGNAKLAKMIVDFDKADPLLGKRSLGDLVPLARALKAAGFFKP